MFEGGRLYHMRAQGGLIFKELGYFMSFSLERERERDRQRERQRERESLTVHSLMECANMSMHNCFSFLRGFTSCVLLSSGRITTRPHKQRLHTTHITRLHEHSPLNYICHPQPHSSLNPAPASFQAQLYLNTSLVSTQPCTA